MMKTEDLQNRLNQTLQAYEKMEDIQVSLDWNTSLIERLKSKTQHKTGLSGSGKFTLVVVFFILLNLGFLLNVMIPSNKVLDSRNGDLKLISEELLINTISVEN